MVEAFEFFGYVPREVWWDNPKTVVARIFKGRERKPHERYAALASHYAFDPLFCMPACGNEKPYAENRVYDLQRRFATPVPKVKDLAELNVYLRDCCLKEHARTSAGQTETIGDRFGRDRAAALPLPAHRFDPCIHQAAVADKYQTVRFDGNRYSVPRPCAFRSATVKAYIDHVEVVADGQVVAHHARSYEHGQQILDPLHYLATLGRRPAALDHSNVYRDWRLPAGFTSLRATLEERYGDVAGARQYIRVLQLLAQHPVQRVERAIDLCGTSEAPSADRIIQKAFRLAEGEVEPLAPLEGFDGPDPVMAVRVPTPDLSRFDELLSQGEPMYA
jgi:hypothetical protein